MKLKEAFTVEEEGEKESTTEAESQALLQDFIDYIKVLVLVCVHLYVLHDNPCMFVCTVLHVRMYCTACLYVLYCMFVCTVLHVHMYCTACLHVLYCMFICTVVHVRMYCTAGSYVFYCMYSVMFACMVCTV